MKNSYRRILMFYILKILLFEKQYSKGEECGEKDHVEECCFSAFFYMNFSRAFTCKMDDKDFRF